MYRTFLRYSLVALAVLMLALPSGAETFGSEAQPVIQEIEIHKLTDFNQSERESKDNLEDIITPEDSSKTLNISMINETEVFRYEFIIKNEGDSNWQLSDSDSFYHEGIDSGNWTIDTEDVWYQFNDSLKERGANIEVNRVKWDTSNGGTLSQGEYLNGSYIFSTDQNSSEIYSQNFSVINSESNAGSYLEHNTSVEMANAGKLNVTMHEPVEDTRLQVNRTFEINSTVECMDGECGNVNLTARYNQSGQMEDIPASGSQPFYTVGQNPKNCQGLIEGDLCTVSWEVNATGEPETKHKIDVKASSSLSQVESNQSEKRNVSIDYFLIIRDYRDTTSFGAVDPGSSNNSALGNSGDHGHNVTVDEYSQPVDELYFKVSNLTSYFTEGYRIGPGNISYSFENETATAENASGSFEVIKTDIQPGETIDLFYWLNVPSGVVQDYYNGTASFAAQSDY